MMPSGLSAAQLLSSAIDQSQLQDPPVATAAPVAPILLPPASKSQKFTAFSAQKAEQGVERLTEAYQLVREQTGSLQALHKKILELRDAVANISIFANKLTDVEGDLEEAHNMAARLVGVRSGMHALSQKMAEIKVKATQEQNSITKIKDKLDTLMPTNASMGEVSLLAALFGERPELDRRQVQPTKVHREKDEEEEEDENQDEQEDRNNNNSSSSSRNNDSCDAFAIEGGFAPPLLILRDLAARPASKAAASGIVNTLPGPKLWRSVGSAAFL